MYFFDNISIMVFWPQEWVVIIIIISKFNHHIITIKQCHHHKPSPRRLQKKESRKFKCPPQFYHQYIIGHIIQVHQDEEAEVELSNFEPLEVPPSQTGLNVTGVQVSSSFPGFRGNFSSLDITLVIQVDLQYYVGAISGQHSGAYVFRFGLFEVFSISLEALQRQYMVLVV